MAAASFFSHVAPAPMRFAKFAALIRVVPAGMTTPMGGKAAPVQLVLLGWGC